MIWNTLDFHLLGDRYVVKHTVFATANRLEITDGRRHAGPDRILILRHFDISLHDVTNCSTGDASCFPQPTIRFLKKGL